MASAQDTTTSAPFAGHFRGCPQACEWPLPLADTRLRMVNRAYVHDANAVLFSSDVCHRLVTSSGLDSEWCTRSGTCSSMGKNGSTRCY
jgi:hypothetical protein